MADFEIDDPSPRAIAAAIARQITSGALAPGERLPTVRELAQQLGVSPATVSHAWQALSGAGLIHSRGRSGSFVRSRAANWLPRSMRQLAGHMPATSLDLSRGTPNPALLPELAPAFSRISLRAETGSYQDVPVIPELEEMLRASWPYPVESVTIVDGALDAISRTLDELIRFGDRVAVENPNFPPLFDLLERIGAEIIPLRLDGDGVCPDSLAQALRQRPAALILQPRAQNPSGISTTPARAAELAALIASHGARAGGSPGSRGTRPTGPADAWAAAGGAPASASPAARAGRTRELLIIEDDHSGEISMAPDVSLGTWLPAQVLHIRSFSKSHGPDLRIAALGGPAELLDPIIARRILGPGWTSRMLQAILHDLLTHPSSIAQVEHAREIYRDRQTALAAALTENGVPTPAADGINMWLPVRSERGAVVQLAAAGIRVAEGASFVADPALTLGAADPLPEFVRVTAGMLGEDVRGPAAALASAARSLPPSAGAGAG